MHEAIKRKDWEITILWNTYRLVDKELPPSQHLKDEQFVEQFEKYCEEELKQSTPKIAQERKEKLIDFINTL